MFYAAVVSQQTPLKKPLLRGYLHQEAFFLTLGASILLVAKSSSAVAFTSSIIYSFGLLLLFGISTIYHRIHWQPKPRALLKRLDHSAIFILIATTVTPICLISLPEKVGQEFLIVIWTAGIAGILQSIFWVKAPKFVTATFYVIVGWLAIPYMSEMKLSLGTTNLNLILAGGVAYTIGAVFYALKKPKLFPAVFGYHELFHLCTIVGAGLHYIVIYKLIT